MPRTLLQLAKVENIHVEFCKEITSICQPLKLFDINYFHFVRSYKDGSRLSLSNNPSFSEYYYDKQFYLQPLISKVPSEHKLPYHLWLTCGSNAIFQALRELFDIDNGITITKHHTHYSDFYYFGSKPGHTEINNFYLVNAPLLERFITYFMDTASSIIQRA